MGQERGVYVVASRRLEDLHPAIQPLAAKLVKECRKEGIDLLIYATYRSKEEQVKLYAIGRTKDLGKSPVTWTLASRHTEEFEDGTPASTAFDCVPMLMGKCMWSSSQLYKRVGEIGKKIGLSWGGDWGAKRKDSPHFQLPR